MSLIDDLMQKQNDWGDEIDAKRAAEAAEKEAADKAAEEERKKQEQHKENKRQGMI